MASWLPDLPGLNDYIQSAQNKAHQLSRFTWESTARDGGAVATKRMRPPPARPVIGGDSGFTRALGRPPVPPARGGIGPRDLAWNDDGFADNVPRSLIRTESSGRWNAENNEVGSGGKRGHFGALQFGHDRLTDARKAGIIPQGLSPDQFMKSPTYQRAVANWHFKDIDERIESNGLDRHIGREIGGVSVTRDGMRAMAHLGGFRGMMKFLQSGGAYNPSDTLGTSLAEYGRTHRSDS